MHWASRGVIVHASASALDQELHVVRTGKSTVNRLRHLSPQWLMPQVVVAKRYSKRILLLKGSLLALWVLVSFGACFFARDLQVIVLGWPLGYWIGSQGAILVFLLIVILYAWVGNRMDLGSDGHGQPE